MAQTCRSLGLEPVVTLQHITHPVWFTRDGGWLSPDAADRFAGYAAFVAPALADVAWVTTINEPNILATLRGLGELLRAEDPAERYRAMAADGSGSPGGVLGAATLPEPDDTVVEALTVAHHAAGQVLQDRTDAAVGWTVATQGFVPTPGAEDAWRHHSHLWEDRFLEVSRDDDWLGVQSYTSQRVGPDGPQGARPGVEPPRRAGSSVPTPRASPFAMPQPWLPGCRSW